MVRYPDLKVPAAETLPSSPETVTELPDNLFVLTSHGTWESRNYDGVAGRYKAIAKKLFHGHGAGELSNFMEHDAHAMDASDFAVGAIANYLHRLNPDAVAGLPLIGRMFANPNKDRASDLETSADRTTFGGMRVWKAGKEPSLQVQEEVMKETWDTFHARVQAGIETVALETAPVEHTLFVDIHDTDIVEFKPDGSLATNQPVAGYFGFPLLLVSNKDGQAAHPFVQDTLGRSLFNNLLAAGLIDAAQAKELGFKENEPYKGAYTTQRYGIDLENAYLLRGNKALRMKAQHMHFIQVELNRAMYILPDRSGVDEARMRRTQQAVANALAETADSIRDMDEDLVLQQQLAKAKLPPTDQWRTAPEEGSAAFTAAMSLQLIAATENFHHKAEPVLPEFRDEQYQAA